MGYYSLKLILLGDAAVGKTSIVNRFIKKKFKVDYSHTVGVDISNTEVNLDDDTQVTLSIWDVAGQESFNFMRSNFYYGTDGVILCFDLTRAETFDHIYDWLVEVKKLISQEVPFILIGNKVDLLADVGQVVSEEEISNFVEKRNVIYRETSAKNGTNVDIIFEDITKIIIKARTYNVDLFENLWKNSSLKK